MAIDAFLVSDLRTAAYNFRSLSEQMLDAERVGRDDPGYAVAVKMYRQAYIDLGRVLRAFDLEGAHGNS